MKKNYINNELRRLINYHKKSKEIEKIVEKHKESESEESEFEESEEEFDEETKKIYGKTYEKI